MKKKLFRTVDYKTIFVSEDPVTKEAIINYSLSETSHVKITLHQALGKEVKKIIDTKQNKGQYNININIKDLANGMYYIKKKQEVEKMIGNNKN